MELEMKEEENKIYGYNIHKDESISVGLDNNIISANNNLNSNINLKMPVSVYLHNSNNISNINLSKISKISKNNENNIDNVLSYMPIIRGMTNVNHVSETNEYIDPKIAHIPNKDRDKLNKVSRVDKVIDKISISELNKPNLKYITNITNIPNDLNGSYSMSYHDNSNMDSSIAKSKSKINLNQSQYSHISEENKSINLDSSYKYLSKKDNNTNNRNYNENNGYIDNLIMFNLIKENHDSIKSIISKIILNDEFINLINTLASRFKNEIEMNLEDENLISFSYEFQGYESTFNIISQIYISLNKYSEISLIHFEASNFKKVLVILEFLEKCIELLSRVLKNFTNYYKYEDEINILQDEVLYNVYETYYKVYEVENYNFKDFVELSKKVLTNCDRNNKNNSENLTRDHTMKEDNELRFKIDSLRKKACKFL